MRRFIMERKIWERLPLNCYISFSFSYFSPSCTGRPCIRCKSIFTLKFTQSFKYSLEARIDLFGESIVRLDSGSLSLEMGEIFTNNEEHLIEFMVRNINNMTGCSEELDKNMLRNHIHFILFQISFSRLWICFSWRIWVCLMSSLVALIISSSIMSIVVVVEMWWSRLSIYFYSTSSRVCLNRREMSWSSLLARSISEGPTSLISERYLSMSSSLEARLVTFFYQSLNKD